MRRTEKAFPTCSNDDAGQHRNEDGRKETENSINHLEQSKDSLRQREGKVFDDCNHIVLYAPIKKQDRTRRLQHLSRLETDRKTQTPPDMHSIIPHRTDETQLKRSSPNKRRRCKDKP